MIPKSICTYQIITPITSGWNNLKFCRFDVLGQTTGIHRHTVPLNIVAATLRCSFGQNSNWIGFLFHIYVEQLLSSTWSYQQQKQTSTMVKTRRSSDTCNEGIADTKQGHVAKVAENPKVPGIHNVYTKKEVVFHLLTELFCRSRQHSWYRILPKDDALPDITDCTRVEWEYLLPMLTFLGLISFKVGSTVKQAHIVTAQWAELKHVLSKHVRFDWTHYKQDRGSSEYFFCIGGPYYRGPRQQFFPLEGRPLSKTKSINLHKAARDKRAKMRSIRPSVVKEAIRLLTHRQFSRITHTPIQVMESEGVDEADCTRVADEVEKNIAYAVALDLCRRPRLSRSNAGNVFHKPLQ